MPQSSRFEHLGAMLRAEPLTEATGPIRLVWMHGWGQSRENLRPLATALLNIGESWLLDLPGHGDAPAPPSAYSPASYAVLVNAWLGTLPPCRTILIGHSLGFRVAVHMALQNPGSISGLVSIAGAGVPRTLTFKETIRRRKIRFLMSVGRFVKPVLGEGVLNSFRRRYGSRDYLAAGENMRPTFLAVANDDVTEIASHVTQPALLVYGEDDTETPPSMARKFKRLLKKSELHLLPHQNHYTPLSSGRHVTEKLIRNFLQTLK